MASANPRSDSRQVMKKHSLVILVTLIAVTATGAAWWLGGRGDPSPELVLYGNVDLRQVGLAFNNSERIAAVLVQEGDRVRKGEILARLDTSRLLPHVREGEARVAAQRQIVEKLHHGSRPQEVAQVRANVESARADAINARAQYQRRVALAQNAAISQQELDNAKDVLDVANAKLALNQKALDLAIAGPRAEDIGEAEADLEGGEAQLALLRQQLADAQLIAPVDAVVRARLMEPGEMASPERPVLSLAVINPKWVRAYVEESDLAKLQTGMAASVAVDSFADRRFAGWVGFVSPVAEFTPKTVETAELRTSLVYEVRVFVKDPSDQLHLGSPATVHLSVNGNVGSANTRPALASIQATQP
jgi:HlyD family secretion protein